MKLIDKSALVAEIERKMNLCKQILLRSQTRQDDDYHQGNIEAYEVVISLLDTLEVKEMNEEPASKDLEEAADKHLVEKGYLLTTKSGEHLAEVEAKGLFKAGAKWQKEQMVKEVDLEKEINRIDDSVPCRKEDIEYIAKHFFELGLKAQKGE